MTDRSLSQLKADANRKRDLYTSYRLKSQRHPKATSPAKLQELKGTWRIAKRKAERAAADG